MASLPPLDFTKLEAPKPFKTADDGQFSHTSAKIKVEIPSAQKTFDVYTEQVVKSDSTGTERSVLFLHGMRFSSKNWLDIQTVFQVADWGWKAVAIDLPGYGQSKGELEARFKADFLLSLISTLDLKKPVIVSPSMSGSFSLPFLFGDGVDSLTRATGYVPVAPINTGNFVNNYAQSNIPSLIVYGTNDTSSPGKASTPDLGRLPKGQFAPIEGAGHACYLDNPDAFHIYLHHFLNQL